MTQTPRERARTRTLAEITRIGREALARDGVAGLSLRAVARELGVVSSAVYRYVASRDELLTLLIVDGYDELGDTVDAALAEVATNQHRERFMTIGRAVRAWAAREPATYALLFGTPVPGYQAPGDRTTSPGTRVIGALASIWESAWRDGSLDVSGVPSADPSAELRSDVARIRAELDLTCPDEVITRGVLAWAALFGCVSFELFGQYGPDTFTDPDALFEQHLAVLAEVVGLVSP